MSDIGPWYWIQLQRDMENPPHLDSSRTKRQWDGLEKVVEFKVRCTVEWAPGVGKSRLGLNAIKLVRRNKHRSVLIVVPTIGLRAQWEGQVAEFEDVTVMVINSVITQPRNYDFLIIDEIHRMGAETFGRIFQRVTYKFVLGLTGTLARADLRHQYISRYAPLADRISESEARREGWIADFKQYNVMVEESQTWYNEYQGLETQYAQGASRFGSDFGLMMNCSYSLDPLKGYPEAVHLANLLGWRGASWDTAKERRRAGNTIVECWGGDVDNYRAPGKL